MRSLLLATSAAVLVLTAPVSRSAEPGADQAPPDHYGAWGLDLSARDPSVAPGDDFFAYAVGGWYARTVIPSDQAQVGVSQDQTDRAEAHVRAIIEADAAAPDSADARKVGDLYKAFLDEARIEALDAKPLGPDLAAVAIVRTKDAFTGLMGRSHSRFGKSLFQLEAWPDSRNPEVNAFDIEQDGLGLPDRSYYLEDGFKAQRAAYRAYIERALAMAGYADPAARADAVMALETRVAEAGWPMERRRYLKNLTHPMSLAQLQAFAPGIDWSAYLAAAGVRPRKEMIVAEDTAIQKMATLYAETPLDTLKAWEAFHVIDDASPYLSKRFVDSRFELTKALTGRTALPPRWRRGVQIFNGIGGILSDAVGQQYVARWFPPKAKAQATELIANLRTAMAQRISRADWLSPGTRAEALKKLDRMAVHVGYPEHWRDYSDLRIDPKDLYGDMERSAAWRWAFQLADLDRPVDHGRWWWPPQGVFAFNNGQENRIAFAAAILQPPIFDPSADPAVNYGAAGAFIGHEITHGFDDHGRTIDPTGVLRDWWTPEDARRFEAQAGKLVAQVDAYETVPGVHLSGKLTLSEDIANLGGLLVALDAYHASLHGKPAPVIDGLTGDQRFFLAWAQSQRSKVKPEALMGRAVTDPHSPPRFAVIGPLRNIDAWYAAFGVTGGRYYLKPEDRVRIW